MKNTNDMQAAPNVKNVATTDHADADSSDVKAVSVPGLSGSNTLPHTAAYERFAGKQSRA